MKTASFYLHFVRNASTLKTTPHFQEVNENGNSIFFVLDFIGIKWGENLFQYSQFTNNMWIDIGTAPGPNLHSLGTDNSLIVFYENQIGNWQFYKKNHCSCFSIKWLSLPDLPTGYLFDRIYTLYLWSREWIVNTDTISVFSLTFRKY